MAEMPPLKAPSGLPSLVKAAFAKARTGGDLTYYATQVAVLTPNSIPFQLRFSPALASKPKGPKPKVVNAKPYDPFEDPPPSLVVAQLDFAPEHYAVLNKFAVVPEHFIVATRDFKPQTHVLERSDIAATYACIQGYHEAGQELYAFFNSGEHSGASQPHRHIQMLPVETMRIGLAGADRGSEWEVLVEKLGDHNGRLPFSIFTAELTKDIKDEALHDIYVKLYQQAVNAVRNTTGADIPTVGEAMISYNMAMTKNILAICPRTREGTAIEDADGRAVGVVSLNGTVLAGTALVKNEAEWDALRQNPEKLLGVLRGIGIPPA